MIGLFGATGFTGRIVCREFAKLYRDEKVSDVRFALIGRSLQRLEVVSLEMTEIIDNASDKLLKKRDGEKGSPTTVFALPSSYGRDFETDVEVLLAIVKQLKVVIGCAGPFELLGEPLIAACVRSGCCDYVDITGEMNWVEHMRAKYDDEAKKQKVRIACACGFDYLPNDYGLYRLKQRVAPDGPFTAHVHQALSMGQSTLSGGTIRSFLHHMAKIDILTALTKLHPFLYIPEKPTTEIQKKNQAIGIMPMWSNYTDTWLGMSLFGLTGSNFMHWTNWNNGYAYGENLIIRYGDGRQSFIQSIIWGVLYSFLLLGLLILSRFPRIANYIAPAAGTGKPAEYLSQNRKFVQMITATEVDKKIVRHTMRYTKGEGYHFTGFGVLRCALAAKNRREKKGNEGPFGVNCATALLKEDLVEVMMDTEAIVESYDTF